MDLHKDTTAEKQAPPVVSIEPALEAITAVLALTFRRREGE